MIQRFIELGEGYSDVYELMELARTNDFRVRHLLALHTKVGEKQVISIAVVLDPATEGKFLPIYICREGIPNQNGKLSQRYQLFEKLSKELNKHIISFEIKASTAFSEKELFYQYLIGILRLHHILPTQ